MRKARVQRAPSLLSAKVENLVARIVEMDKRHRRDLKHYHDVQSELMARVDVLTVENQRLKAQHTKL